MPKNVAQRLIESHLIEGEMTPGTPIGLRIDQTMTQDARGTLAMLLLEAIGLDRRHRVRHVADLRMVWRDAVGGGVGGRPMLLVLGTYRLVR